MALRRTLGDLRALGSGLRWLSRIAWWAGDRTTAEAAGAEAVAVLTPSAAPDELALAHSNLSQLAMLGARTAEAVDHARRAIALAREVGDVQVLMHALNNLGTARWNSGDADGRAQLEESLALALEHDQDEHACRAFCNIVWQLLADGRLKDAAAYVDQGITHAERAEHVVFWKYLHVEKAMVALARGSWDEAVALAATGMDATPPIRSSAVTVLGSVAVRTGRDQVLGHPAADLVAEAWSLSVGLDELQRTGPAALLVCEDAWLRDDLATLTSVAQRVHDEAERLDSADVRERMACWLSLGGVPTGPGRGSAYDLVRAGRHREAAAAFAEQGFVHEAGWALSLSEDTGDLLEALARLDAIGAVPLAARVRRSLRGRGTRGVPRGPRAETRADPAGLTGRQAEVLGLLGQGCTNAEIAARLVLSVRTVDHHVAAVLYKLGASSRQEAVRLAGPS